MEIIQGKTTVAEASRSFDMSPSEIEGWVDEAKRGMENALRTKPLEVKEQYERQIKLCHRFEIPRRTVYCMPTKAEPKLQERFVIPIKAMIEENPSFAYRTVAHLLGVNKNTVQRAFQCKGWQVRKRPVGFRPRIQVVPSVAKAPNKRWATDLCRVWAGRDGWSNLALVINCHTRELLGRHLSRSGKSKTAESALEQALITPEQNGMVERGDAHAEGSMRAPPSI